MFVSLKLLNTIKFLFLVLMPSFFPKFWFNFVHSNFLVYNICWEDSDIDRKLLQINSESDLLTITSAGCNILNYLLDSPNSIHCIDVNPKQTALLELKIALIQNGDYELFFDFFGNGKSIHFQTTYKKIRTKLSSASITFWDSHIHYFNPKGRGFFYSGGAGLFAHFLNQTIKRKGLENIILDLIEEKNLNKRNKLFCTIENKLWNGFESELWKSSLILSLAGIPKSQKEAIGDLNVFMIRALRNVFVEQSASSNFFWRVYLEGSFSKDCCPDYLKEENFEFLQKSVDKIHISTGEIQNFLGKTNQKFSHNVLLDYMDWIVGNDESELHNHWRGILEQANTGSKILFRTAYPNSDFIPGFVNSTVNFNKIDKEWIANNDKVGTYSGTYLGVVQ